MSEVAQYDGVAQGDTFSTVTISWVLEKDDLRWLVAAIETATEVVIDLETTGLDEHAYHGGPKNGGVAARVVLASLTLPQPDQHGEPTTWVLPLSHPQSPWSGKWRQVYGIICRAILRARKPVTNQNMKFDARWTYATTGVDLSHLIDWDTRVSSHALDENKSTKLKERAPDTFGVKRWDDFDLTYPGAAEDVPLFDLGIYAARDTYWTWRLAEKHRSDMYLGTDDEPETPEDFELARLGKLMTWVSMPTTRTLTAMEQRGIRLDVPWVQEKIADHEQHAEELGARLSGMYREEIAVMYEADGKMPPRDYSFAPTSIWFKRWTSCAVDAGDLQVAALTPTGQPQWSKGVLTRQARRGSEVAQMVLDYRGYTKRLEYLRSWLVEVSRDGTVHANYNAGSVVTGRLSSSGPNMQQVTASLRPAFIPREGYVLAEIDQSQIELRVAAFISRCVPMMEAYQRGDDLHKMLAARITGKAIEDITAAERQAGKSANFGLLYMMGPLGFREYAEDVYGVSFTMDEAETAYRAFFDQWDGISDWHRRVAGKVQEQGYVVSPLGRIRRLPQIWWNDEKKASGAVRAAINSPVQGMASDIMQIGAALIEGTLPGSTKLAGAEIVGTVHDSVMVEVLESDWASLVAECQKRLTTDVVPVLRRLGCEFDVPLLTEAKVGTRWGLKDVGEM